MSTQPQPCASQQLPQLPVLNLDPARFECVFPTCGGTCCVNGRPPLERAEQQRIAANLEAFLPHLRPQARARVERGGFVTRRIKEGLPTLAVSQGRCVFENEGCVLHKLGAAQGDRWQYKPWRCIIFPLERSRTGRWHVRQWGLMGEAWDLFCLNPAESLQAATGSLPAELEFARELEHGNERWRREG